MDADNAPVPATWRSRIVKKDTAYSAVSGPCWLWVGWNSGNGYGKVKQSGRAKMAHRAIYELLVGPVASGNVLDHLCRERSCVNPHHMEPVTMKINTERGRGVSTQFKCKQV